MPPAPLSPLSPRCPSLPVLAILLASCEQQTQESDASRSAASTLSDPARGGPRLSTTLETPPLHPPTLHPIGQRAVARDYAMQVISVGSCEVEAHFEPDAGKIKLGVLVELEGLSQREVPANPFLAKLRDADAREYKADPAGCTPTLSAGRVSRGGKRRGFISFQIPATASGLEFVYAPFVVGSGEQKLRFDLNR